MSRRPILLSMLVVLAIVAVWQVYSKRDLIAEADFGATWAELTQNETATPSSNPPALNVAAEQSFEPEDSGPPTAQPVPEIALGTEGEMFPFKPDTPLLETTVSLPERRAPMVYYAYCADSSDTVTSASAAFGEMMKFQMRAQTPDLTLVNIVPNRDMMTIFRKAYEPMPTKYSYEDYLADAQDLKSDILIHPVFNGTPTEPEVILTMLDLNTSRTETWHSKTAGISTAGQLVTEAAAEALRFAGCTDQQIGEAGVYVGAPSEATFAWFATSHPDEFIYENMLARIADDPDCLYTYNTGKASTSTVQLYDLGLRRAPDDIRFLCGKAVALGDSGSTAAALRMTSELIRRNSDNVFVYFNLPNRLNSAFPISNEPKHTPPVYKAMVYQLGLISERYKEGRLPWEYAYGLKTLGGYIRGGKTADRIPAHVWTERNQYVAESYAVMKQVAEARPNVPAVVKAMMYYDTDAGVSGLREQKDYIKRMAELDPRDTEVELAVAASHSVGWGDAIDYIRVIDAALKAHDGDPHAIRDIVRAVSGELERQIAWKVMTHDQAYTSNNPYVNRVVTNAEYVYSQGLNLGMMADSRYYAITAARGQTEKIEEWRRTGQNSYVSYKVASEAHSAGDFEKCLKFARLALPFVDSKDEEHRVRYYEIKSLWKLKRYEESLKAARAGILAMPGEQTFPYMYAVVGLEYGKDLETAFDCATLAVNYSTDNPGCNETFEKLRAKLNKPQHPALAALRN